MCKEKIKQIKRRLLSVRNVYDECNAWTIYACVVWW